MNHLPKFSSAILLLVCFTSGTNAATPAADAPRYATHIICFMGALDSRSSCSTTIFPLDDASRSTNEMTCGLPGKVSEIVWKFVRRHGDKDVYQFKRTFPFDTAAASTTMKTVEFGNSRVIVFQDAAQAIVIEPPTADELRSTNSPAAHAATTHYAILPTSEGPALLKQCSRGTPKNVTGYWTPLTSQIAEMEKLLPEFLKKSGYNRSFSDSCRQYVGIISHGKQLIYVNAFPKSTPGDFGKDWQTKAVIVCDGGEAFWGVVFDPADNTFHDFATNGMA
jgi:hypothetical protein